MEDDRWIAWVLTMWLVLFVIFFIGGALGYLFL